MSAFIVEPDCNNCIVTFIHEQAGFFCRWLKLEHVENVWIRKQGQRTS
jgi:hypothetical protein